MTFNDVKILEVNENFNINSIRDLRVPAVPVVEKLITSRPILFDEINEQTKKITFDPHIKMYVDSLLTSFNSNSLVSVHNSMVTVAKCITPNSYDRGVYLYSVLLREGSVFSENGMLFKLEKGKFVLTNDNNIKLIKFSEHEASVIPGGEV